MNDRKELALRTKMFAGKKDELLHEYLKNLSRDYTSATWEGS